MNAVLITSITLFAGVFVYLVILNIRLNKRR